MKKLLTIALVLIVTIGQYAFKLNHSDVYTADKKLSGLEWYAEKVTGKHNGTILLSSGTISSDHGNLSAVFEMNMNSIVCKDLQGEWAEKLEMHLKSEDFFYAEKFPTAKFVSTSITSIPNRKEGGFTHAIKGNLTIKDKTHEISFGAVIKSEGNNMVCVGEAIVDRSKFDIRYGSKTFFPEIGDKMINDEFKIKFNVVAVK